MPEVASRPTVAVAVQTAAQRLADAGCDTPRLDAELLLGFVLGVDRARLVLDAADRLSPVDERAFDGVVARRVAREPVAYITGVREFRRLALAVDSRVLIPRSETELLVEQAVAGVRSGASVVDVGTGSGAVALALKDERPDVSVVGVDVSADAVDAARANARRLGLDVSFVVGDLLPAGRPDAVVANLPYVRDGERLEPEIARYEPDVALFGGDDGLDVVRRLVGQLDAVPFAALEIGAGQAGLVSALLRDAGFASVRAERDLAGIERVVVGRR